MADKAPQAGDGNPRNEKHFSLNPLTTEEALRRAMQAGKPEERDEPDQQADKGQQGRERDAGGE